MRIDPIEPTLKAPGTKRLKLKCDKLLSSLGFNFNLRRYAKAAVTTSRDAATNTGTDTATATAPGAVTASRAAACSPVAPSPAVAAAVAAATNTYPIFDLAAEMMNAGYEPEPPLRTNPCAPWGFRGNEECAPAAATATATASMASSASSTVASTSAPDLGLHLHHRNYAPAPVAVVVSRAAATNTESIYRLIAEQKTAACEAEAEPPVWTHPCAYRWTFRGN